MQPSLQLTLRQQFYQDYETLFGKVTQRARTAWQVLDAMMSLARENGWLQAAQETIAAVHGLSRETVNRRLPDLEEMGYVTIYPTPINSRIPHSYRIDIMLKEPPSADEVELSRVRKAQSMPYLEYLQTDHWREMREKILVRAKYQCECCGTYDRAGLDIHHLNYDRLGAERLDDLLALCNTCHRKIHSLEILVQVIGSASVTQTHSNRMSNLPFSLPVESLRSKDTLARILNLYKYGLSDFPSHLIAEEVENSPIAEPEIKARWLDQYGAARVWMAMEYARQQHNLHTPVGFIQSTLVGKCDIDWDDMFERFLERFVYPVEPGLKWRMSKYADYYGM